MSFFDIASIPWLTVITGHYGVGKTTLSLNLARDLRAAVARVTLIDLDIVNPYFRSTDHQGFLDAAGVEVLGPVHAASNLDTPSLSPGIDEAIEAAGAGHAVFIDMGGDPDGARALGRYARRIAARPHHVIFVANTRRPETASVAENLELLRAIEGVAGVRVTGIFGNTHLKELTTVEDVVSAIDPARMLAKETRVPLVGVAVPRSLAERVAQQVEAQAQTSAEDDVPIYPVDPIVATPWENLG